MGGENAKGLVEVSLDGNPSQIHILLAFATLCLLSFPLLRLALLLSRLEISLLNYPTDRTVCGAVQVDEFSIGCALA